MNDETVLRIVEAMLKAGLRAMHEKLPIKISCTRKKHVTQRKSNTKILADLLRKAGRPLHVDEIILLAGEEGVELHRESIVSAMTKKLLAGKVFRRTGKNEFALLDASYEPEEVK